MAETRVQGLDLTGLTARPAQVWGAIRLVPLVRAEPIADLRLHRELYEGASTGMVDVGDGTLYTAYIPHGFVADFTRDGSPAAAYGTQLTGGGVRTGPRPDAVRLHFHRRMARRQAKNRLRFLPLHLALEGYLALHFGGPSILWEDWSRRAVTRGLSPRVEQAYVGGEVAGLADALRVFEIHPGQCGVMVYAADGLAAAFAVPHPDDYRVLHPTLVEDLYGELIHHYAHYGGSVPEFTARVDDTAIASLADLRAAAREQQRRWESFHGEVMAGGLLAGAYAVQRVRRMGPYTLSRFLPPFERHTEQHIGETITGRDGRIAYLKTFRLSENQVRRGHLLATLAAHDWHLGAAAGALGATPDELRRRISRLGFGALLRHDPGRV